MNEMISDLDTNPRSDGRRSSVARALLSSKRYPVESKRAVQILAIVDRALRGQWAASPVRSPWVFSNRDGGPLDITNLRERVWRPALRRATLRARTQHQTRHTFATLMLELGESPGG